MEVSELNSSEQAVAAESYAFPLTFAQTRLWFLDQLEPDQTSYLVAWALRIEGELSAEALAHSINNVVSRHEIFRTTFKVSGGEPVQVVASALHIPLPLIDLTYLESEAREVEARRLAKVEADTPINLERGPLLRTQLLRLSADDHLLLLTTHHIVFDGWSRSILLRELSAGYESFLSGNAPNLAELPIQYADFAVWQREHVSGANLDRQFSYWEKQLEDSPESLELPTDRPRPAVQTDKGALSFFAIPQDLTGKLKAASREQRVTLNMMMLAAFQVLLSRYSGQEDILVGSPIANRNRAELEGLIGLFANALVLRTRLDGDPSFSEVLRRVKESALAADAHQDMPFEKLVQGLRPQRSLSHSPLFQVLFSLRNTPASDLRLGKLKLQFFGGGNDTSKYDLSLYLEENAEGIRGKIEYNTDLFDESTIVRMQRHYRVLLKSVLESPEARISGLEILDAAERQQIVVEWNQTAQPYERELCLHQVFQRQAARRPDSPAVAFGDHSLTYEKLNARANQVAHLLRGRGVGQGHRVGVYLDRSLNMLVALLGVLKSGAAYVPLDPAYPAERVRGTLNAAKVSSLITEEWMLPQLPTVEVDTLCLERDRPALAEQPITNPEGGATPADPAYVMFTSGSTGQPKGVVVGHRGVLNQITWMQRELEFGEGDAFPAITSFAFDVSIPELFIPLITGGMVALGEKHLAADGEELARFVARHRASVVQATPTTWSLLLAAGFTGAGLKRCIGAEPLPSELFTRLMDSAPGTPLFNVYGPTETTVWSTFHRFESSAERIVIGRPLSNTQIYILDPRGRPVPIGISGEIHIGGDGVAHGYLFQPELTAEKFIPDTFSTRADARLYKTGDLGRYLPDGRIEFAGRRDFQVKIRGFRIELSEIEAVLARHPAVKECVVIAREDQPGNKFLAAYLVPANSGGALDFAELRNLAKEYLPDYMLPVGWLEMERLPLTPNGKVDRQHLPAPEHRASKGAVEPAKPGTLIEIRLAKIWEEILNVSPIGPDDDFFSLGGHSLLAVQMMSRARDAFNCELPLTLLFSSPKLGELASAISTERGKAPFKTTVPIRKSGSKTPLFCISRPNVNALGYIFLARSLSPDHPVIGVQFQMEKDENSWAHEQADYERKAEEYIREMRKIQPNGPYLLTGYCEGAHIAFEMARKLEAMNQEVAMLAVLDQWPVENTRDRRKFMAALRRRKLRQFRELSLKEKYRSVVEFILEKTTTHSADGAANAEKTRRKLMSEQRNRRYWPGPDYVPTQFGGRITLFRVKAQDPLRIDDYRMGWAERAVGGVEVIDIGGEHDFILREPHVIELAHQMQTVIDRSLEAVASKSAGRRPSGRDPAPLVAQEQKATAHV